ncbi:MAG: ParB N-terminal domain-containing protein [bacterium]|nr:ParB N-terminal domain-containing protein [bacterium]
MQNVSIASIKIGFRARFDFGNITELAEDIKHHGLLHPIVVTSDYALIAGFRRLKAAELLGWQEIPAIVQIQSSKEEIAGNETKFTIPNSNNKIESSLNYTLTKLEINSQDKQSAISKLKQFDMQLSENMQRKDLTPLELCEAILERKHRFEQVYGKIKHGGDHMSEEYQKSKLSKGELAFPDFYEQTAKLLKMSITTIYRFLQLKDLDPDLKELVSARALGYREALYQQSERNRARKKTQPQKALYKPIGVPSPAHIAPMQEQYQSAPNLIQLFMLIQHSFQIVQKLKKKPLEYDKFKLEYFYILIPQMEKLMEYYGEVLSRLLQEQEKKLQQLTSMNIEQPEQI